MTENAIKVLLVDDEQLIRSGLAILLEMYEEIEIVGQAANGQEAIDFCATEEVDVVLMDIRMPETNGIEGTKQIKEKHPHIHVLILTTFQDMEYIAQAMKVGASGYLLKDSNEETIYEGIKLAHKNNLVIDGKMTDFFTAISKNHTDAPFDPKNYELSSKEVEIIRLVASGYSNQEIADELFLSLGTIKNNTSLILNKLDLRDRTQLAIFAFEKGLMN
ncbi:MAG TPA: response regulator transcription factor [Atopostipes sp.]|jgi:DNA-binding NarL/FixJ family response regulator|nr:response regulator transcription factor [Aerococcaceae bacterium DSM 111020]HZK22906.1 response regulator transcription factor [Atopostipes sp.]